MLHYYRKKEAKSFITYHVPVKNSLIGAVARQLVRKFIGTKSEVK